LEARRACDEKSPWGLGQSYMGTLILYSFGINGNIY